MGIDFAFMDANHTYQASMEYFHTLLEKVHPNSLIILDDIHWSKEMEQAWMEIKNHKAVSLSIDLFQVGLLFFREGREKEDFVLWF